MNVGLILIETTAGTLSALDGMPMTNNPQPMIGVVTALTHEFAACKAVFSDGEDITLPGTGAGRRFWLASLDGVFGDKHKVVVALADKGNNSAAIRATTLFQAFPGLRSVIMTGIAGGVPNPTDPANHVRLGDIVVSNEGGVIQYDFDKETVDETLIRALPRPPHPELLEAVRMLEVAAMEGSCPYEPHLGAGLHQLGWHRPASHTDALFDSNDPSVRVDHPQDSQRTNGMPRVFLGLIAATSQ